MYVFPWYPGEDQFLEVPSPEPREGNSVKEIESIKHTQHFIWELLCKAMERRLIPRTFPVPDKKLEAGDETDKVSAPRKRTARCKQGWTGNHFRWGVMEAWLSDGT